MSLTKGFHRAVILISLWFQLSMNSAAPPNWALN